MKQSVALLSALAATGLAAPGIKWRPTTSGSSSNSKVRHVTARAEDEYNESWAGAVVTGESYSGVSSTFTVPTPQIPSSGETSAQYHTVSSWIGLDGYGCNNLWQAGVDGTIDSSGTLTYYAWYEWYPAETVAIDLGDVTGGDVISVNITTSSTTEGTIVMENKTKGKTYQKSVTSSNALCGLSAEWIMEDLSIDGDTEGLAKFTNVTFADAVAIGTTGNIVTPSGATLMDIQTTDSQEKLTLSSVTDSTVVVTYL